MEVSIFFMKSVRFDKLSSAQALIPCLNVTAMNFFINVHKCSVQMLRLVFRKPGRSLICYGYSEFDF